MRPPLMSGASWQEGAGGGMLVGGLQDGGRVNNTQLIVLFPSSWRREKKIKAKKYCQKQRKTSRAGEQLQRLQQLLEQMFELNPLKRLESPLGRDIMIIKFFLKTFHSLNLPLLIYIFTQISAFFLFF